MGTCLHFSRALPSNSWWQTMVGWEVLSRPPAAEGGAAGPPLQGLLPSHTRPPRSTAGNINSAGCLKTGPQYTVRKALVSSRQEAERHHTGFGCPARSLLQTVDGASADHDLAVGAYAIGIAV